MAFRSEAHRRWWFANRAAGGTGVLKSLSTGVGSASDHAGAVERERIFAASPSQVRQNEKDAYMLTIDSDADAAFQASYDAMWTQSDGPDAAARQAAKEREADYMASPARRLERAQYAQAMFPDMSEADALRTLNDREG